MLPVEQILAFSEPKRQELIVILHFAQTIKFNKFKLDLVLFSDATASLRPDLEVLWLPGRRFIQCRLLLCRLLFLLSILIVRGGCTGKKVLRLHLGQFLLPLLTASSGSLFESWCRSPVILQHRLFEQTHLLFNRRVWVLLLWREWWLLSRQ